MADRYEPEVNRSYAELAQHYGAAVLPARAGKPRDKAAVEAAVLGVERELLTPLLRQQRRCCSLAELNEALREGLAAYNAKPFQKRAGSRQSVFASLERPALLALPERDYEFAAWLTARVNVDHHVTVRKWHYSAPASLLRKQVDVRLSAHSVELFHRGERVALHRRERGKGGYSTIEQHRPKAHREHLGWPPERIVEWAAKAGPETAVEFQIDSCGLFQIISCCSGEIFQVDSLLQEGVKGNQRRCGRGRESTAEVFRK